MGSDLLVSAVCPTFNRPAYLAHAVKLFLAQTWTKSELIILDDSDAAKALDLPSHPRIRHVRLKERLSIGHKHNMGNAFAQGDVIAYFDDDDYWAPRRFVMQLGPIVTGEAKLTGLRRDYVLTAGPKAAFWRLKPWPRNPQLWVGNGATNLKVPIHDGSAMYSREAVDAGLLHPDQTMNEKVEFLNTLADSGFSHKVIDNDALFVYVRHGKNTWQYKEELVHAPAPRPIWFPADELDFYRKVAA